MTRLASLLTLLWLLTLAVHTPCQTRATPANPIVLHAARLLDIKTGRMVKPAEILIQAERIVEVGTSVKHPAGAEVIDLGDRTLLPGLIDAHVHLFLHPGAEDLQTVQESVPQRTITATMAYRDDLMAGFTAERDMGTEGAGSADTAIRNAIDRGAIPGPRLRISGNAIDILGGHEDAIEGGLLWPALMAVAVPADDIFDFESREPSRRLAKKRPVALDFATNQRIEIYLMDSAGNVLTKWSDNHAIVERSVTILINPQERVEYNETIATRELTPNKGFIAEVFFPQYPELRIRQKFLAVP